MASAPSSIPKASSKAFARLYQLLKKSIDAPTLVVVLYAASDRKRLEGLYSRFASAQGPRAQMLAKEELVGAVAGWFFASHDVAHALIKELDRSCKKELYILASIPDGQVEQRLQTYQGLQFRRERAKLIWALLRDTRSEANKIGVQLALELVQASSGDVPVDDNDAQSDERLQALKQKIEAYETMVDQAHGQLKGLAGQVAQLEKERAELMGRLGRKQSALRSEEELRRRHETEIASLRKQLREARETLKHIDPQEHQRLSEERDKLASKLRRLEKKIVDKDIVDQLRQENQSLRQSLQNEQNKAETTKQERQQILQSLVTRDKATQERLQRMRQALKTARRMAAEPGQADQSASAEADSQDERVGIFVDAANISASAKRAHGGQFDFSALLKIAEARKVQVAIAYVVDNGQSGFQGFASALREMGYKVKIKKPSQRPDGSIKADWDMAIAMDIVDARHRLDTVLIASGDGDFVPLLRRLRRWRKSCEVTAFSHAIHPELRRLADRYIELNAAQVIGAQKG